MCILEGCDDPCAPKPKHDVEICKTKDDFRKLTCPPPHTSTEKPKWQGAFEKINQLPPCFSKRVSLSLSGKIPLHEAFVELAEQAGISIILDTPLTKPRTIFYRAQNQPLMDVLENLCALGNLRYYFEHNALHICNDTPYLKSHNIQFLLGVRKSQTQTTVKTDILAEGLNTRNRSGSENGASINLSTSHTADFWEELEKNITSILCSQPTPHKSERPSYSLNKYSGMLSLYACEKQQRMVAKYLAHLQKLVNTQVLIEAKIIEIDLLDEHKSGVNWNAFNIRSPYKVAPLMVGPQGFVTAATQQTTPVPNAFSLSGNKNEYSFRMDASYLNALATFMEQFGTVRTLANPRLTVLNNQSAVLKVAHNEVFFELQLRDEMAVYGNFNIQKAQSRIQTVPIGLILYVHPSVNFETGEIVVSLHPTISRVTGSKSDPAVALSFSGTVPNVKSEIPIVQIREMDSVIVARENQVIVTGGLMEERAKNESTGVPGLSDIPILGALFKSSEKERKVTELVILLRLSIVGDQSNTDPADERLYKSFVQDPRPFPASR